MSEAESGAQDTELSIYAACRETVGLALHHVLVHDGGGDLHGLHGGLYSSCRSQRRTIPLIRLSERPEQRRGTTRPHGALIHPGRGGNFVRSLAFGHQAGDRL